MSRERKYLPNDKMVYLLVVFIAWMGVTTVFSIDIELSQKYFIKVIKIQWGVLLTLMLFNTKERIHQLLWVIVVSLGYFSVKGGVFTLLTAGSYRVYGPPDSFVAVKLLSPTGINPLLSANLTVVSLPTKNLLSLLSERVKI